MLREITWTELQEWMAFNVVEPFDEERQDIRVSAIQAAIYNVNRDPKRKPEPFKVTDFAFRFGDTPLPEQKKTDWRLQKAMGMMIAQAFNSDRKKARK